MQHGRDISTLFVLGPVEEQAMKDEELLAEVEDLIRTIPNWRLNESLQWKGRALAVLERWSPVAAVKAEVVLDEIHGYAGARGEKARDDIQVILHHAQYDLRMKTVGPLTVVADGGSTFEYFDEIRKVIEMAQQDVFFVDPYLDAEFVTRYLPQVRGGVSVRLLSNVKITALVPAVDMFTQEHGTTIEVRSFKDMHDRFLFVDRSSCYQSGASFKDGAKRSPTTLTQIVDGLPAISATFEGMWKSAEVEFPRPS